VDGGFVFGDDSSVTARSLVAVASTAILATLAAAPVDAAKICAWSVPSEMLDHVYSGTARAGQTFRFKVVQDAELDTGTPVPAGTVGYGIVRAASAAVPSVPANARFSSALCIS